jgi:hypothetical protein
MNAGLKAGHLGDKGRAFVVIANELKATADRISGGAKLLQPVLDNIEQSANRLRTLRQEEDLLQVRIWRIPSAVLCATSRSKTGSSVG